MENNLIITALLVPFVTFAIWFMKKTVNLFIKTMSEMLETNKTLSSIIKNELKELTEKIDGKNK